VNQSRHVRVGFDEHTLITLIKLNRVFPVLASLIKARLRQSRTRAIRGLAVSLSSLVGGSFPPNAPSVGWRPCHVLRTGGAVLACCAGARPAAILRQIKVRSCQYFKISNCCKGQLAARLEQRRQSAGAKCRTATLLSLRPLQLRPGVSPI